MFSTGNIGGIIASRAVETGGKKKTRTCGREFGLLLLFVGNLRMRSRVVVMHGVGTHMNKQAE